MFMCVCMCIYIYIYIHIHKHINTHTKACLNSMYLLQFGHLVEIGAVWVYYRTESHRRTLYIYICVYVCMYVFIYTYMYTYIHKHINTHTKARLNSMYLLQFGHLVEIGAIWVYYRIRCRDRRSKRNGGLYVCMYVCMYAKVWKWKVWVRWRNVCMYVCIYVCMYAKVWKYTWYMQSKSRDTIPNAHVLHARVCKQKFIHSDIQAHIHMPNTCITAYVRKMG
jgi:hypothetical protein